MKRSPVLRFGLALTAAALVWGCAGRPPAQRRFQGSSVSDPLSGSMPIGSTTGDFDRCAFALGNPSGDNFPDQQRNAGGSEVTANGLVIGNVALVALPALQEDVPLTNAERLGVGGMIENNGVSALDRVFLSCKAHEIRVLENPEDQKRLAQILLAIRKGQPATNFLADFADLNSRAKTAHGQNQAWPPAPPVTPGNGINRGQNLNAPPAPNIPQGAGGPGSPTNEWAPGQTQTR